MFDDFSGVGRQLLIRTGKILEYRSQSLGTLNIWCTIDESPSVQEATGFGGINNISFQTPETLGYVDKTDMPDPKHGDVIVWGMRNFVVSDPHDGGGGLWEFTAKEDFSDE